MAEGVALLRTAAWAGRTVGIAQRRCCGRGEMVLSGSDAEAFQADDAQSVVEIAAGISPLPGERWHAAERGHGIGSTQHGEPLRGAVGLLELVGHHQLGGLKTRQAEGETTRIGLLDGEAAGTDIQGGDAHQPVETGHGDQPIG